MPTSSWLTASPLGAARFATSMPAPGVEPVNEIMRGPALAHGGAFRTEGPVDEVEHALGQAVGRIPRKIARRRRNSDVGMVQPAAQRRRDLASDMVSGHPRRDMPITTTARHTTAEPSALEMLISALQRGS